MIIINCWDLNIVIKWRKDLEVGLKCTEVCNHEKDLLILAGQLKGFIQQIIIYGNN